MRAFPAIMASPIQWLLRDEFSDTRVAGSVNGTMATPGPGGARTLTDTGSKMNIIAGSLSPVASATSTADADPDYSSSDFVSRVAGRLCIFRYQRSNDGSAGNTPRVGLVSGTAPHVDGDFDAGFLHLSTNSLQETKSGAEIGSLANLAYAVFVFALRASGYAFFRDGLLLGLVSTGTATPLTFGWHSRLASRPLPHIDYARVPADLWLPAPLVSDGFGSSFGTSDALGHAETSGIGSGGGNVAWVHNTYSISSAKAINTPGVGSELVTNGDFSAWTGDNPDGWSIYQESPGTREVTQSGSQARIYSTSGSIGLYKSILSADRWYLVSENFVSRISGNLAIYLENTLIFNSSTTGAIIRTGRATGGTTFYAAFNGVSDLTIDDVSVKELTLANLFASCLLSTADVFAGVDLVITSGTQAGMVLNLDSTSSPANFVIAYHDGTNAKLEKCVAGTYTSVISAAATYSSGARLVVSKIGTAYRLYYNNALVGSGTISDSGIVNNTRHGLFSTYAGNTMDNFTVYASGSGGEYNVLNRYVNL